MTLSTEGLALRWRYLPPFLMIPIHSHLSQWCVVGIRVSFSPATLSYNWASHSRLSTSVPPIGSFEVSAPLLLKSLGVVVHFHSLHHLCHLQTRTWGLELRSISPPPGSAFPHWYARYRWKKHLFFFTPHSFIALDLSPICCPLVNII